MTRSVDILIGRRNELLSLIKAVTEPYHKEIEQIDKMLKAAGKKPTKSKDKRKGK